MQSDYEELLEQLQEAKDIASELWDRWEPQDVDEYDQELIRRYNKMQLT